jgi:hypothetical protein
MLTQQITVLEEVATSVEERFERTFEGPGKQVSRGWWLVIKRLGLALYISKEKPQVQSGDILEITIKKREQAMQRRAS